MLDDKKTVEQENASKEIDLDNLDKVTGGTLKDAEKKKTSPISDETRAGI